MIEKLQKFIAMLERKYSGENKPLPENLEDIKKLIENYSAQVFNEMDPKTGKNILHIVAELGKIDGMVDIAKKLVNKMSDWALNHPDNDGHTPLNIASINNDAVLSEVICLGEKYELCKSPIF